MTAALGPLTRTTVRTELKAVEKANAGPKSGFTKPSPAPVQKSPPVAASQPIRSEPEPRKSQPDATLLKNVGSYVPAVRAGRALGTGTRYERILKAEWIFGMLLIFLYPILKPGFTSGMFAKWVGRMIAWTAVYIMLLLVASMGARVARVCAAFGGLALLALMLAPYTKNGQVNFDLTGAKSLQAAIDRLTKITGTSKPDNTSPGISLPDDEANRINGIPSNESAQPLNINLGDGMGSQVYRISSTGAYFPQSEFQRNKGGS